jgi:chemotaxis protein methyltransferase CheR
VELGRAELERLAALLARRSGLAFPEGRWPFLCRQAAGMVRRSGFASPAGWAEAMERPGAASGRLYAALEEALQVPATGFFRYPHHYAALRTIVLPARWQAARLEERPRLRFWSVGCATGEEPYSIAMVLRDSLPAGEATRAEVLAVDASREALAVARRGRYAADRLSAVPPECLPRHFRRTGREYVVAAALRRLVTFLQCDVRQTFYPGTFDAIFCCNVLLYYTPEARCRLLDGLATSLVPGGFLFLGHADGIAPPAARFTPVASAGGFVYRRC